MSGLSDIIDFKLWEGKKVWKDISKKPSRMLTGVDPWSTNVWNTAKGTHDKPIVDQMGGTTKANMSQMDREGMNTSPGRRMEDIAHVVAAFFGAKGLAGIGGGSGVGGGAAAGGGGMGIGQIGASEMTPALMESAVGTGGYGLSSAGLGGAAGVGGVAGFNMGASNPALIDSALGTEGYGASSAGPGGGSGMSSGLSGQQWQQLGQKTSQMGDDNGSEDDITGVDLAALARMEAERQMQLQVMAQSSKKVKTKGGDGLSMARGVRGEDMIDANGAQIAGIQELQRQIADVGKRIAMLKKQKGGK